MLRRSKIFGPATHWVILGCSMGIFVLIMLLAVKKQGDDTIPVQGGRLKAVAHLIKTSPPSFQIATAQLLEDGVLTEREEKVFYFAYDHLPQSRALEKSRPKERARIIPNPNFSQAPAEKQKDLSI